MMEKNGKFRSVSFQDVAAKRHAYHRAGIP